MRRFIIVLSACLAVAGTAVAGFSFAGVASPQKTADQTATTVNVSAIEYSFVLTDANGNAVTSVPAGQVTFHVKNNGTIEHDFTIAGQKTPTLEPGQSADLTVTLQGGQSYNYACTIGEHASFGMTGSLNVTGQIQTTTQVITTNGTTITTTQTQTQTTPPPPPITATVKVSEKEFKILLPSVRKKVTVYKRIKGKRVKVTTYVSVPVAVKHGRVKFIVKNIGKLGHNFVIGSAQTTVLKPGKSETIIATIGKGKHKYLCSIQGHAALGMKGTLVAT